MAHYRPSLRLEFFLRYHTPSGVENEFAQHHRALSRRIPYSRLSVPRRAEIAGSKVPRFGKPRGRLLYTHSSIRRQDAPGDDVPWLALECEELQIRKDAIRPRRSHGAGVTSGLARTLQSNCGRGWNEDLLGSLHCEPLFRIRTSGASSGQGRKPGNTPGGFAGCFHFGGRYSKVSDGGDPQKGSVEDDSVGIGRCFRFWWSQQT